MIYGTLFKHENKFYLHTNKMGNVTASTSKRHLIENWENAYQNSFNRGICGATGAMLFVLNFSPKVFGIDSEQSMIEKLNLTAPPFKLIGFGVSGIECDGEELYKTAESPELVYGVDREGKRVTGYLSDK